MTDRFVSHVRLDIHPHRSLRPILAASTPQVIVEAHDALSALIVEQAGLPAVWASSLTMSAAWGVRDANELAWTQVVEVLEHMVDATNVPILADGDSGHGDFNTVRRFVRRLSQRGVAGVCFEDQCFPKTNSLVGEGYPLASVEEFCGKLEAAKEAQHDDDFVVVARVEALIAGLSMGEALRRAEAYRRAGADAVLIHSRRSDANEVLAFAAEWAQRAPLIVVPTTYSGTPVSAYEGTGIAALIWANHTLRAAVAGMRALCETIKAHRTPHSLEPQIATVADVFRMTAYAELEADRVRFASPASAA
jgi:phosphoenolpyruvate phosphomutase